jgi:hypothetical protein
VGVYACDATPYADARAIGDGWIKLGDAGLALDPLSSTGVEKAVQTALVGSIAVHTMLARPANAPLAEQFYRERQAETAAQHAVWSAGYYAEARRHADRPFWRARSAPAPAPEPARLHDGEPPALLRDPSRRCALSPHATFAAVPCLDGELVEARRALHHPRLARPIVFVDDIPLAPLLEPLSSGTTVLALMRTLAAQMSPARALRLVGWLTHHGVVFAYP